MRTRAYRRHQRARAKARHLGAFSWHATSATGPPRDIAIRHPFDCGGRCLLCHPTKFLEPRRTRQRREWLRDAQQGDGSASGDL
jgi:hypothetical protein